jgi:hypothetical protein
MQDQERILQSFVGTYMQGKIGLVEERCGGRPLCIALQGSLHGASSHFPKTPAFFMGEKSKGKLHQNGRIRQHTSRLEFISP